MNWKDLKLGMKLGTGFGVLILISLALGILAIVNMSSIKTQSEYLGNEYIPEVAVANNIERYTLRTMYAMRAYGLTREQKYLEESRQYLRKVNGYLDEAGLLANRSTQLEALKASLEETRTALSRYEGMVNETEEANLSMAETRRTLDKSAADFVENNEKFIEVQNRRLKEEMNAGANRVTLQERREKIFIGGVIQNTGNQIRVKAFKAQSDRDISFIDQSEEDFKMLFGYYDRLREITRLTADIEKLDESEASARAYRDAMMVLRQNLVKLKELGSQRDEAGSLLLANVQAIAEKGISETNSIAELTIGLIGTSNFLMIFGLISAIIMGVVFAVLITRSIVIPISLQNEFINKIAGGDLTATLNIDRNDEVGDSARALKQMVDKLQEIIASIVGAAGNIAAASEQMSSSSQQMSEGATEQAASAEQVSSSMEEMSANIQQNTDNAMQTEKIALKAADDIQEGSQAVNDTMQSMKEIADKIGIIGEIARQTNLLALNAAVEAARAGEHGKGFAVVAAEVRKLAERSQVAATEIDQVSVSSVAVAEKSGKLLEQIVPDIQKTARLVQEISASSREQSTGAEQVNTAIQQLNEVTQQNAASAEEMASSSEELASQAEQMRETVSFFKIDQHSTIKPLREQSLKPKKPAYQPGKKQEESRKEHNGGINLQMEKLDDEFEEF